MAFHTTLPNKQTEKKQENKKKIAHYFHFYFGNSEFLFIMVSLWDFDEKTVKNLEEIIYEKKKNSFITHLLLHPFHEFILLFSV